MLVLSAIIPSEYHVYANLKIRFLSFWELVHVLLRTVHKLSPGEGSTLTLVG
jgi:hypothetical protein